MGVTVDIKKLKDFLRSARENAGMTQEELAKELKTKRTAISRLENHAYDMKLSTLTKYLDALGKKLVINIE